MARSFKINIFTVSIHLVDNEWTISIFERDACYKSTIYGNSIEIFTPNMIITKYLDYLDLQIVVPWYVNPEYKYTHIQIPKAQIPRFPNAYFIEEMNDPIGRKMLLYVVMSSQYINFVNP